MDRSPPIASLGEIARQLDIPIHRIDYIIRTRHIEPALVAGGRHFYSEATVRRIASELRRIDEERGVDHASE